MYTFYRALLDDVLKDARKDLKKLGKWEYEKAAKHFFNKFPILKSTMDFMIACDELAYLNDKRGTSYIIQDRDAFEAVDGVRIDTLDISMLLEGTGVETFTVAFPHTLGRPGVLVNVSTLETFNARIKAIDPDIDGKSESTDKYSVNLSFSLGRDKNTGFQTMCRLNLPLSYLNQVIKSETVEEFASLVPIDSKLGVSDLTLEEKRLQFSQLRFVVKFLTYRAAAPERIRFGLPHLEKPSRFIASASRSGLFSVPEPSGALSEHYRRAHLRQLRDQRFYQGEHAKLPVGSRVVFVKDSIVNSRSDNVQTFDV